MKCNGDQPTHCHQLVIPNKFAEDTKALSSLSILTDLYGKCGVVAGKWSDLPPGEWIQELIIQCTTSSHYKILRGFKAACL